MDRVVDAFFTACDSMNCCARHPAVPVACGMDPSVRFIGSHISVLLPLMLAHSIPVGGIAMWQDCVRTRVLASMKASGQLVSAWGSYFLSIGALLPQGHEDEACVLLAECLTLVGVPHAEVSFLATDQALATLAKRHFPSWSQRADSAPRAYRHKVGVEHVRGENLNIAIAGDRGTLEPVANVIVYNDRGGPCGIEVALGTSTVVKVLLGLDHVLDAFPLPEFDYLAPPAMVRCWKDAVMTSSQLLREGLRVSGPHNRSRLLRSYLAVFGSSPVTQALSINELRSVLYAYLAEYYNSCYTLPAARSDDEIVELLVASAQSDAD